jgi:single-strand DNA-binding protein
VNGTYVTLMGLVATRPEVKGHDTNQRVRFRLVATARRRDQQSGAWVDGDTTWVTVTCWRQLAKNVEESVTWKDRVIVHGRLRTEEWTAADGGRRTDLALTADAVGPDLSFGTAAYSRRSRAESMPAAQAYAGPVGSAEIVQPYTDPSFEGSPYPGVRDDLPPDDVATAPEDDEPYDDIQAGGPPHARSGELVATAAY